MFSQMPHGLVMGDGVTVIALRTWHHVYVQTLGRPGWDLSYQQIADAIGHSRRAVIDAVSWLIDNGWLVKHQQVSANGDPGPNLYAVCREPHVTWAAPRGEPDRTTGGAAGRTHRDTHHQEKKNTPPPSVGPPATATQDALVAVVEPITRRARRTPLPDTWRPDDDLARWTEATLPNADYGAILRLFRDHAKATGRTQADWNAAWRVWIGKEVEGRNRADAARRARAQR